MKLIRARLRPRRIIPGIVVAVVAALLSVGLTTTPATAVDATITATVVNPDDSPFYGEFRVYAVDEFATPAPNVPEGYSQYLQSAVVDGSFSVALPPGSYKILFKDASYAVEDPLHHNWYAGYDTISHDVTQAFPLTVDASSLDLGYLMVGVAEVGSYAVEAIVQDGDGNGLESSLTAYRFDPDAGAYDYYDERYTTGGVFSVAELTALELPGGIYKFKVDEYESGRSKWWGGPTEEAATPYALDADLDLGSLVFPAPVTITGIISRAASGSPVSGASVGLEGEAGYFSDTTGATGAYQLYDVPEGEYSLEVWDNSGDLVHATEILVVGAVDLVHNVALLDRARITGTVTNATGVPLRQVQVVAYDLDGEPVDWATTGSAGGYRLRELDPGVYRVGFTDPSEEYAPEFWSDVTTLEAATPVVLGAGELEAGKDAVLGLSTAPVVGVDLLGKVTSPSGGAADGISVYAYTGTYGEPTWESAAVTDRSGNYRFRDLPTGNYTLVFTDLADWSASDPYLPFVSEFSGDKQVPELAATVQVTADATSPRRYDAQLQRYGVVSGTVSSAKPERPLTQVWVEAYDADEYGDDEYGVNDDGSYAILVRPGTYTLRFDGASRSQAGEWADFVREYWNNSPTMAGATPVNVSSGQRVTGINATLTVDLEVVTPPRITGAALVGSTLTANPGSWNLTAQNTYTYTWLRGATPVQSGTAASYVVKAADAGQQLRVQVEATHFALQATAFSATVAPKFASIAVVAGTSPKPRVAKLVVTVRVPGLASPGGTITVKRGTKVVKSAVAVTGSSVTIKLAKQPAGRQRYTVTYSGTAKVLASSATVTVRVRR